MTDPATAHPSATPAMACPRDASRLLGADERLCDSHTPGALGGHRRNRMYGRLDCPTALRALAAGTTAPSGSSSPTNRQPSTPATARAPSACPPSTGPGRQPAPLPATGPWAAGRGPHPTGRTSPHPTGRGAPRRALRVRRLHPTHPLVRRQPFGRSQGPAASLRVVGREGSFCTPRSTTGSRSSEIPAADGTPTAPTALRSSSAHPCSSDRAEHSSTRTRTGA
jgi:hypothetical protein